jgi:hypothetical protein
MIRGDNQRKTWRLPAGSTACPYFIHSVTEWRLAKKET